MTLILSDKLVRDVADMPALVDALEKGLRAEVHGTGSVLPERMNLALGQTMLRVMPAILPAAGVLGLKLFYGTLEEGIRYSVMLCALAGGEVLAMVDAAYLTALRTGATSGVATRYLAPENAHSVGLIGSGLEAETNLEAVCAVRTINRVRVYSRSAQRRAEFARRMATRLDIDVEAVDTAPTAVAGSDIVIVATNTGRGGEVALRGEWLEPGQHVVSIGSTATFLREIDEDTFLRSDVAVFDASAEQVARESGDLLALAALHPDWTPSGTLDDVLTSSVGRTAPDQITLFKSVGTAAQDLLGAHAVYRLAVERGVGLLVPDLSEPKQF
jgi:ornithine cyclodeaminase/alanine dehydrogenase-like protein (mu-crystallin family)